MADAQVHDAAERGLDQADEYPCPLGQVAHLRGPGDADEAEGGQFGGPLLAALGAHVCWEPTAGGGDEPLGDSLGARDLAHRVLPGAGRIVRCPARRAGAEEAAWASSRRATRRPSAVSR